jgi:hypothetical protein
MLNIDNTNRPKFCRTQSGNKCIQIAQKDKIRSKSLSCNVLHTAKQWRTQKFFSGGVFARNFFEGGSTNSDEDRGQRERRSGGGSPLVRGSTQFANE